MQKIRPEDLINPEQADWAAMTPGERFTESMKLWDTYLSMGGSLDPDPDSQSPFFDPDEWREEFGHGRASVRVLRRGRV
jgi:hypothetical protein